MEIDELVGADPNTLPYFVVEARTGKRVAVQFASVTVADEAELRGEDWSQAVFRDVWPALVRDLNTFKLMRVGEDSRIQGMVRVGDFVHRFRLLKKSLLEAAPFNRHGQGPRQYQGVGRVLVARLVAESLAQGGRGRVLVSARPGTQAFYASLGFENPPNPPKMAIDDEDRIRELMQSVLLPASPIEETT